MNPPAGRWAPLLVLAILGAGIGAGLWKQAGLCVAKFCILFALLKTAACWGAWLLKGRGALLQRAAGRFWAVSLFAAMLNGAAWLAYFAAFTRGPLGLVQTLTGTYVAVGTLLAVLFLRERTTVRQGMGIILVLAAGMLMAAVSEGPWTTGRGGGWLLPGLAAVGLWGVNTVLLKYGYGLPGADDYRMYLANWSGLFLTLIPFGLFFAPGSLCDGNGWLPALAVAALYVLSDLALYAATARAPAAIVNSLYGIYPGVSIAYGALLLGEVPDFWEWFAIALGLGGTLLVTPKSSPPLRTQKECP